MNNREYSLILLGDRVQFCEKCGTLLFPAREGSKTILKCEGCGIDYSLQEDSANTYKMVHKINHSPRDETIIVSEEDRSLLPTTKMECPKCKKIVITEYWFLQTRRADEGETRFFRCKECSFTWREYD